MCGARPFNPVVFRSWKLNCGICDGLPVVAVVVVGARVDEAAAAAVVTVVVIAADGSDTGGRSMLSSFGFPTDSFSFTYRRRSTSFRKAGGFSSFEKNERKLLIYLL